MKVLLVVATICLSACSWFGPRRPVADPTELIVNGSPAGSALFIDGRQVGDTAMTGHPVIVRVAAGDHTVEVHKETEVVYREDIYAARGEHRVITVLSGASR